MATAVSANPFSFHPSEVSDSLRERSAEILHGQQVNFQEWNEDDLAGVIVFLLPKRAENQNVDQFFKDLRSLRKLDVSKAINLITILARYNLRELDSLLVTFSHDLSKRVYAATCDTLKRAPLDTRNGPIRTKVIDEMSELSQRVKALGLLLKTDRFQEALALEWIRAHDFDQALDYIRQLPIERRLPLLYAYFDALKLKETSSLEHLLGIIELSCDCRFTMIIYHYLISKNRLVDAEKLLWSVNFEQFEDLSKTFKIYHQLGILDQTDILSPRISISKIRQHELVSLFQAYTIQKENNSEIDLVAVASRLAASSINGRDGFLERMNYRVRKMDDHLKVIDLYLDPENRDKARQKAISFFLSSNVPDEVIKLLSHFERPQQKEKAQLEVLRYFLEQKKKEYSLINGLTSEIRDQAMVEIVDVLNPREAVIFLGQNPRIQSQILRDDVHSKLSKRFKETDDLENCEWQSLQILNIDLKYQNLLELLAVYIRRNDQAKIQDISERLATLNAIPEKNEDSWSSILEVKDAFIRNHFIEKWFQDALDSEEFDPSNDDALNHLKNALLEQTDHQSFQRMLTYFSEFLKKQPKEFERLPLYTIVVEGLANDLKYQDAMLMEMTSIHLEKNETKEAFRTANRIAKPTKAFIEKMVRFCMESSLFSQAKEWIGKLEGKDQIRSIETCVDVCLKRNLPEVALSFVTLSSIHRGSSLLKIADFYINRGNLDAAIDLLPLAIYDVSANDRIVRQLLEVRLNEEPVKRKEIEKLIEYLYQPIGDVDDYINENSIAIQVKTALDNHHIHEALELLGQIRDTTLKALLEEIVDQIQMSQK